MIQNKTISLIVKSEKETINLGIALGKILTKGSVVLLDGNLGSGKTTFAKGVAKGLGINANVNSPTFTVLKRYSGFFNHLDLYRLDHVGNDFDLLDYINDASSITLIEWPFKVKELIPSEYLLVTFKYLDNETRQIEMRFKGSAYQELVSRL